MDKYDAKKLEVSTEWNGKANVCVHCGRVPETFYVATGHDHTDYDIKWCPCRETSQNKDARVAELEAQLAETEALEISHGERIEKLTKLLLLAKNALEEVYPLYNGHAFKSEATEAIAAINDSKAVEGLILCDRDLNYQVGDVIAYAPRRTEK